MNKPFWEETYKNDSVSTFAKGPTADIAEYWMLFKSGATVLDVGCGEGRNSIFLAGKEFFVDAFDISEAGISKAIRITKGLGISINFFVQDLTKYVFIKNYDIILSHGVLHLTAKKDWLKFINDAKLHTNIGGYNAIGVFTNKLPATPDNAPFTKGLFEVGELPYLYEDWEQIHHLEGVFEDEHPGGIKHVHAYEGIISKRL